MMKWLRRLFSRQSMPAFIPEPIRRKRRREPARQMGALYWRKNSPANPQGFWRGR